MDNNEILLKTLQKENELLKENCIEKLKIEERYEALEKKYEEEIKTHEVTQQEKNRIQKQLTLILDSRSYKVVQKIKKIIGR